jgi:hypothetical protein
MVVVLEIENLEGEVSGLRVGNRKGVLSSGHVQM